MITMLNVLLPHGHGIRSRELSHSIIVLIQPSFSL